MIRWIPDVKRGEHNFTDGVGTMSMEAMLAISSALSTKWRRKDLKKAEVIQIRAGGVKGMLTLDRRLTGKVVCFRDSMKKCTLRHSDSSES